MAGEGHLGSPGRTLGSNAGEASTGAPFIGNSVAAPTARRRSLRTISFGTPASPCTGPERYRPVPGGAMERDPAPAPRTAVIAPMPPRSPAAPPAGWHRAAPAPSFTAPSFCVHRYRRNHYRRHACLADAQLAGHLRRHVHHAADDPGATVLNPHHSRLAILEVGHARRRAERQGFARGRVRVRVEPVPIGHFPVIEMPGVVGYAALLLPPRMIDPPAVRHDGGKLSQPCGLLLGVRRGWRCHAGRPGTTQHWALPSQRVQTTPFRPPPIRRPEQRSAVPVRLACGSVNSRCLVPAFAGAG